MQKLRTSSADPSLRFRVRNARTSLDILMSQARTGTLWSMPATNLPMDRTLKAIVAHAGCRTVQDFLEIPEAALFSVPGCTRDGLRRLVALRQALSALPRPVAESCT